MTTLRRIPSLRVLLALVGLLALGMATGGADWFHNHKFCDDCTHGPAVAPDHDCPVHILQLGGGQGELFTAPAVCAVCRAPESVIAETDNVRDCSPAVDLDSRAPPA